MKGEKNINKFNKTRKHFTKKGIKKEKNKDNNKTLYKSE